MNYLEVYIVPYLISNAVALLILWAAWKKTTIARVLFALLFSWACAMNLFTAIINPSDYLGYAEMALDWYKNFIEGWFASHITFMVSLIAIGQGTIAIGMLLTKPWVKLACIGAIVFLIGIAPLGVGSAFPFSITVSVAAYIIFMKKDLTYLWRSAW